MGAAVFTSAAWAELLRQVRGGLMVRSHSGQVRPGEVFVAVAGSRVDGATFIPQALAQGAAVVVARPGLELPAGTAAQLVPHPEPAQALGQLAAAYHGTDRKRPRLVGVTGTNGKTTTTYLLEHLLNAAGRPAGLIGTVTWRWPGTSREGVMTTPDCWTLHGLLAEMAAQGVGDAVMEVSSHALDQGRVAGLAYEVGVITNLTQDHLDYHGDLESYFQAKSRLFTTYAAPGATAVVNAEDVWCRRLLISLPEVLGYGLEVENAPQPMLRGQVAAMTAAGLELDMSHDDGRRWHLTSGLVGRFNAMNLLAAQGAGLALGLSPAALGRLADFSGVPGRVERVANGCGKNIFIDYAHTPDALENVLAALRGLTKGRLMVVFGCGGDRDRSKRPLMAQAASRLADVVVLTSDNPRHEEPLAIMADARPGLATARQAVEEADRRAAIAWAVGQMNRDDVLVVAGKGHETYQQIGDVKHPFSDHQVVREVLECA